MFKKLFDKNQETKIVDSKSNSDQNLKQETTKRIYLTYDSVSFDGNERCESYLKTQRISESNAKKLDASIELVYRDDKLVEAYERQRVNLSYSEIGFDYKEYPIHSILKLRSNKNGKHQLGGKLPSESSFPDNNCKVPFQYLGYISHLDKNFSWLSSTIHLMCPIYLNINKVYLDYSNKGKPILINRLEVEECGTNYDGLSESTLIEFDSLKFDLVPKDGFSWAQSGVAFFLQNTTIPKCPKSGKLMKFLCQISGGVSVSFSNANPKVKSNNMYFQELDIWEGGILYVFVEPTEQTVCYFIQCT